MGYTGSWVVGGPSAAPRRGRPKSVSSVYGPGSIKRRGAAEAKVENPDTVVHEAEDIATLATTEGLKQGQELLRRIQRAGSDPVALESIQEWVSVQWGPPE